MAKTGKHKKAFEAWAGCEMYQEKPCECNGYLIPVSSIISYFSDLFKKQKNAGRLTKKQVEKEATQAALINLYQEEKEDSKTDG